MTEVHAFTDLIQLFPTMDATLLRFDGQMSRIATVRSTSRHRQHGSRGSRDDVVRWSHLISARPLMIVYQFRSARQALLVIGCLLLRIQDEECMYLLRRTTYVVGGCAGTDCTAWLSVTTCQRHCEKLQSHTTKRLVVSFLRPPPGKASKHKTQPRPVHIMARA
jgi:hypothetical protein